MAKRRAVQSDGDGPRRGLIEERGRALDGDVATVAGIPGPGRWLVGRYLPTALFSLKMSQATSSVGKSLLVPTMYAIKMALVDGGFRAGLSDGACDVLLRALIHVEVRIAPPARAVVTHTFVKIRQEPKRPDPLRPYGSNIAYREVVHHWGEWRWAFDLAGVDEQVGQWLVTVVPHVNSIGKRGSFVQFMEMWRQVEMPANFTQPQAERGFARPARWHVATLDEFGPEASLPVLSSYSSQRSRRDRHRAFVQTIVPLGLANTGPGFSEYASGG